MNGQDNTLLAALPGNRQGGDCPECGKHFRHLRLHYKTMHAASVEEWGREMAELDLDELEYAVLTKNPDLDCIALMREAAHRYLRRGRRLHRARKAL